MISVQDFFQSYDESEFRLSGKSIHYNCDLKIKVQQNTITAQGHARFALWTSPVNIQCQWSEDFQFLNYSINAEDMNWWQKAESLEANKLQLSSSQSENSILEIESGSLLMDPLLGFIYLATDILNQKSTYGVMFKTFSAKKIIEIQKQGSKVQKDSKEIFSLQEKKKNITLKVRKLKLQLIFSPQ